MLCIYECALVKLLSTLNMMLGHCQAVGGLTLLSAVLHKQGHACMHVIGDISSLLNKLTYRRAWQLCVLPIYLAHGFYYLLTLVSIRLTQAVQMHELVLWCCMQSAHGEGDTSLQCHAQDVMTAAGRIGAGALRLDPLDGSSAAEGRRGPESSASELAQLRQHLTAAMSQQGGTQTAQTPALYACLEVSISHCIIVLAKRPCG